MDGTTAFEVPKKIDSLYDKRVCGETNTIKVKKIVMNEGYGLA